MKKLLERLFIAELKSAATKNFRLSLTIMFIGCLMMASLSVFVTRDGGFGVLFAFLLFWHRYVMLKVSKVYLASENVSQSGSDPESSSADA